MNHRAQVAMDRSTPPTPRSAQSKIQNAKSHFPLDRSFAGWRMSAVDQAFRYAINLPCDCPTGAAAFIRFWDESQTSAAIRERFEVQGNLLA
jgi:hypothetical protein